MCNRCRNLFGGCCCLNIVLAVVAGLFVTLLGVILGAVMASEGLADTLINELNLPKDTPVVLTGGYAKDVERYFNTKVTYIENLTLKGLNAIYTINKSKSR